MANMQATITSTDLQLEVHDVTCRRDVYRYPNFTMEDAPFGGVSGILLCGPPHSGGKHLRVGIGSDQIYSSDADMLRKRRNPYELDDQR